MATSGHEELARLRPQLLAFARRRLGCRHRAEDVVQETLLAALEGLSRYAGGSSLKTWLFGILKHKIVDVFRGLPAEVTLDEAQDLPQEGACPERAFETRGVLAAVDRGLDSLPARHAHAFVLREALGMETDEICGALGITPSHCWVLLHRARARLRDSAELRLLAEAG